MTLVEERLQLSSDGYATLLRVTDWLKLPVELIVTVERPVDPAVIVRDAGLAASLKPETVRIVTVILVELVISLFVPPVPVRATVYVPAVVPVIVQVPETVPPAVKVRGDLQVTLRDPGPLTVFEIATGPAKPFVAEGLPRLVVVSSSPADFPVLKVRLVVFVERVNPPTLTVIVPEFWIGMPVALSVAWYSAAPWLVAVPEIVCVTVAPEASANGDG